MHGTCSHYIWLFWLRPPASTAAAQDPWLSGERHPFIVLWLPRPLSRPRLHKLSFPSILTCCDQPTPARNAQERNAQNAAVSLACTSFHRLPLGANPSPNSKMHTSR